MTRGDLASLEPRLVWRRFLELTHIPRPPRGEDAAREYVLDWAGGHRFERTVDAAGNAVVRVHASRGRESAAPVVLQAHLDMVCERDPDSPYDPRDGRIHVLRDGDWVLADGTTLGADNGIGVAAAMAAAEDPRLVHGPLELLFTVCEEEGLEGAKALDPALVAGRLLVNLDGTSDGAITIGCAGSGHTFVRLRLPQSPAPEQDPALLIRLTGGRGGHSGGDIGLGRANAVDALGAILRAGYEQTLFRLVRLDGGVSRNAIPREAEAVVALSASAIPTLRGAVNEELGRLRARHAGTDDGLTLSIVDVEAEAATDDATTENVLQLLAAIPIGVVAMSTDVDGAVETSTSLNVARTDDDVLTLASMTRSSVESRLEGTIADIERIGKQYGAEVEVRRSYPPWRPDLGSSLLATARRAYQTSLASEPQLEIVHGGLECAVIGSKLPGVEMVALGPRIEGPHAPGERLSIPGTQRFYRLLGDLLDELSR